MDVKLVVLGGKRPGQEIAVQGPEFLVGRAPECKMRPNSDMVSRRHCMISIAEGRATIRDLGSRNGTIVNDRKIASEHELRTGDKIKIGPLEFEVHLSTSVSGKKKPKVHNVQEAAARTVEAAKPRDSEPDISDWLNEEDAESDTKKNKLTSTFVPPTIEKPAETAPAASGQQQRIDPLADPGQAKKPVAESSRVAAADMLKQFFQPRRPETAIGMAFGTATLGVRLPFPYESRPVRASNPTPKSSALLGIAFDNDDGHTRLTRGDNFVLVGGSQETHAIMQETAVKINEHLDRQGKRLEDASVKELRDICQDVREKHGK